jgi:hypothetical protein
MENKRPPLVVPTKYYEALGHLAALGPDAVEQLSALAEAESISVDVEEVASRFSRSLKTSNEKVLSIFGFLMSLNELRWERAQDPVSLEKELTAAIVEQAEPGWKDRYLEMWRAVSHKLPAFLMPNGFFSLLRKAYDLALNRHSLVLSLQILSDARPLYDEDADALKALVLSHTLTFRVQQGSDRQALHITLDAADMQRLSQELDRAIKKEATLKKRAGEWGVPVIQLNPR